MSLLILWINLRNLFPLPIPLKSLIYSSIFFLSIFSPWSERHSCLWSSSSHPSTVGSEIFTKNGKFSPQPCQKINHLSWEHCWISRSENSESVKHVNHCVLPAFKAWRTGLPRALVQHRKRVGWKVIGPVVWRGDKVEDFSVFELLFSPAAKGVESLLQIYIYIYSQKSSVLFV